jgi:hypothetical protein
MRIILAAVGLGLIAVPALPASSADAQRWRHSRGHWNEVRQERRECRRELRRADSRWEFRRELRECRREIADARRDRRHDRRWYGRHRAPRYWDGWRWRYRW